MGPSENLKTSNSAVLDLDDPEGVVVIGANQLRAVLTPSLCLSALEDAYRRVHVSPSDTSQSLGFETRDGKFHVKAGLYPGTHKYFAAKVNANFPENRSLHALPTIQGLIVLCDGTNGKPLAVIQSGELTGLRTAAATALAARRGARADSAMLAVVGCGAQARHQLAATIGLFPIKRVTAYDRAPDSSIMFAAMAEREFGVEVLAVKTIEETVSASDIVITCTTATQAILMPDMIRAGTFIAAVGADNPDKQELDPNLFKNARILVDDLDQCAKSGDLAHAIRAGIVGREDVAASLAELVSGTRPGRTRDDQIVIFDSTGTGLQDVAAAAAAFRSTSR